MINNSVEFYWFISLLMTVTLFQGLRGVRKVNLNIEIFAVSGLYKKYESQGIHSV